MIALLCCVDVDVDLVGITLAVFDASKNGADGGAQSNERTFTGPAALLVQHDRTGEILRRALDAQRDRIALGLDVAMPEPQEIGTVQVVGAISGFADGSIHEHAAGHRVSRHNLKPIARRSEMMRRKRRDHFGMRRMETHDVDVILERVFIPERHEAHRRLILHLHEIAHRRHHELARAGRCDNNGSLGKRCERRSRENTGLWKAPAVGIERKRQMVERKLLWNVQERFGPELHARLSHSLRRETIDDDWRGAEDDGERETLPAAAREKLPPAETDGHRQKDPRRQIRRYGRL